MKRRMPAELQAAMRCFRILSDLPADARKRVVDFLARADYEPDDLELDKARDE